MDSLYFKIKDTVDIDKHRLIELFFKGWIDDTCDNQVQYEIKKVFRTWEPGMVHCSETFRVYFEKGEDAVALRLKGIPEEFRDFLEIIE